ncbi:MAG: hypothetical protein HYZ11_05895 [Candidatus Tectomicrobia bacterium]|uniref:Uncharacterized protein n=1 Tax=Tectimicrobiota bacterium TaxID=2528274 RepID=A0A932I0E6_UNCTE|nr:hypothetical protein [Candidatus Tectomicrobia bacterium]
MKRLVLTRLVLPILLVCAALAAPFVWLPEVPAPASQNAPAGNPRRPGAFQGAMTLGFALILVSVTAGGAMLYRITRDQTASWRRRFAPRRRGAKA